MIIPSIQFKRKLIIDLVDKLPKKVLESVKKIKIPSEIYGYVRFNYGLFASIYPVILVRNKKYHNASILKYNYEDSKFIFKGIYLIENTRSNGSYPMEIRYNENMDVDGKYINRNFEKNRHKYITTKVEKMGKVVNINYKIIKPQSFEKQLKYLEENNIIINNRKKDKYLLSSCGIKETEDNILYLTLS